MHFLRIIIALLISLTTAFTNLQADICGDFKNAFDNEKEYERPYEIKKDIGLYFDYELNKKKQNFILKRDKNNFPVVRISFLESQISPGTSIETINNINLATITDEKIKNLSKLNKTTKVKLKQKKEIIILNPKDYYYLAYDINDFVITSVLPINTKEGYFSLNYLFSYGLKRPDLLDESKILSRDPETNCARNDEIDQKLWNYEDWIYIKSIDTDADKVQYDVSFFYDEDYGGAISDTTDYGSVKILNHFAFEKFPFETQSLKIEITHNSSSETLSKTFDLPVFYTIKPSEKIIKDLLDYLNNNFIKEWNLTDVKVMNSLGPALFDPQEYKFTDNFEIHITMERVSSYYLFKIILPVFLILCVAWFVLWIPTHLIESRLTTSTVALLALIAYNFVFQNDLPKLGYLTSLDKYILLSYFFCAIPTFQTIYFSRLLKNQRNYAFKTNRRIRNWGIVLYFVTIVNIFLL